MYIELLKRVSTHGDWEAWILFFLQGVLWQAQDARDRVKRIMELQARYRERARSKGRTKATLPAIDVVMERVVVTARDIQNYVTNLSDNTARAAIRDLVALKILNPVPLSTFPQRWWAQELIDQVYQS
jgi:Fic family protein